MNSEEYRQRNHDIIQQFLNKTDSDDDISSSIKCVIAQFILAVHFEIQSRFKHGDFCEPVEVVNIQQCELRRCIVEMEQWKKQFTEGMTEQ